MPLNPVEAGTTRSTKDERRYLFKALRLREGEKIEVFDGAASSPTPHFEERKATNPYLEVQAPQEAPHPEHRLFVAVATPKKATEPIGWSKKSPKSEPVVLSGCKPSAVSCPKPGSKKFERWARLAEAAARQSAASGFHKSRAP